MENTYYQVSQFGGVITQYNTLEEAIEAAKVCNFTITEVTIKTLGTARELLDIQRECK